MVTYKQGETAGSVTMVASLLNLALTAVVKDIQLHEDVLKCLPNHIKSRCLNMMSKRGLLTDSNLPLVSR